jgi:hypothetical protein
MLFRPNGFQILLPPFGGRPFDRHGQGSRGGSVPGRLHLTNPSLPQPRPSGRGIPKPSSGRELGCCPQARQSAGRSSSPGSGTPPARRSTRRAFGAPLYAPSIPSGTAVAFPLAAWARRLRIYLSSKPGEIHHLADVPQDVAHNSSKFASRSSAANKLVLIIPGSSSWYLGG